MKFCIHAHASCPNVNDFEPPFPAFRAKVSVFEFYNFIFQLCLPGFSIRERNLCVSQRAHQLSKLHLVSGFVNGFIDLAKIFREIQSEPGCS